jgi:hypothetical protein
MSRRHRPLGEYLRAAAKLAEHKPQFLKYVGRHDLTPQQKSTIARVARLPPLVRRTDADWVRIAIEKSKFAPGLKKYKRRKRLNNGEKSAISHKEKILRYSDHLIPVTKKQAKKLKDLLFAPGVQAIQLRNTAPDARIVRLKKDMVVTSNGRTFIYWRLENVKKGAMKKAAKKIFTEFNATFEIEHLAELAERAFKKLKPIRIYLWAEAGRVGEGFKTFDEFMQWLYEDYSQYKNVERWVNGIAIQVAQA